MQHNCQICGIRIKVFILHRNASKGALIFLCVTAGWANSLWNGMVSLAWVIGGRHYCIYLLEESKWCELRSQNVYSEKKKVKITSRTPVLVYRKTRSKNNEEIQQIFFSICLIWLGIAFNDIIIFHFMNTTVQESAYLNCTVLYLNIFIFLLYFTLIPMPNAYVNVIKHLYNFLLRISDYYLKLISS